MTPTCEPESVGDVPLYKLAEWRQQVAFLYYELLPAGRQAGSAFLEKVEMPLDRTAGIAKFILGSLVLRLWTSLVYCVFSMLSHA